jgi:GTP-binding protein
MLVDTGGVELSREDAFQIPIRAQAQLAAQQADLIILLVDGKTGLTSDDEELARLIKRARVPIFLVVNKVDEPDSESESWDFYRLGLGKPWTVSATHGTGTGDLLDGLLEALPPADTNTAADADTTGDDHEPASAANPDFSARAIRVALIGRPNAGKSTLLNRLAGTERSIVSEEAGTTRDAVDIHIESAGRSYVLIDTAGLRRKALIDSDVEYYGFVRAMRAIDRADIAVLVIDAGVGLTDQDQRIASYAIARGCGMVIVLNKWDLMHAASQDPAADAIRENRELLLARLEDRLTYASWAELVRVSATRGKNCHTILPATAAAFDHYCVHIPTSALNRLLSELREFGHVPAHGSRRLRLNYVTQTHQAPPGFTFFCNYPQLADDAFQRYLERRLRETFDLTGTPVFLKFRKKDD